MTQVSKPRKPKRSGYAQGRSPQGGMFVDPAKIETRFYALELTGDCLEPKFKSGQVIIVDRDSKPAVGDFAAFYYRPELLPAGSVSPQMKRLFTSIKDVPLGPLPAGSEIDFCVGLEQLNPPRRGWVECSRLAAVHLVIGSLEADQIDPEVRRKFAVAQEARS
jgi:hypothetical protein